MSAALGIAMIVGAVLFFATTIAFAYGKYRADEEIDEVFEIAKALGAYGVFVRMEAEALGITVEELIARDARLSAEAMQEMSGDEIVENVHRSNARRLGDGWMSSPPHRANIIDDGGYK